MRDIELHPKLLDNEWLVNKMNQAPEWFIQECSEDLMGFDIYRPDIPAYTKDNLKAFFAMWQRQPTWEDMSDVIEWKINILEELNGSASGFESEGKNWNILVDDTLTGGCGDINDCVGYTDLKHIQTLFDKFNKALSTLSPKDIHIFKTAFNEAPPSLTYKNFLKKIPRVGSRLGIDPFANYPLFFQNFPLGFLVLERLIPPWPFMNWNETPILIPKDKKKMKVKPKKKEGALDWLEMAEWLEGIGASELEK